MILEILVSLLFHKNKQILNNLITKKEILTEVNNMKSYRAPGPDGFTMEFYKAFQVQIHSFSGNIIFFLRTK